MFFAVKIEKKKEERISWFAYELRKLSTFNTIERNKGLFNAAVSLQ